MNMGQTHPADLYCEGSYTESVQHEKDEFDPNRRQCFRCNKFVRTYGGFKPGYGRLMAHRAPRGEGKDNT